MTRLLICLFLSLVSAGAFAQCNPSTQCCAQQGTGETCEQSESVASVEDTGGSGDGVGNPINVLSGNKFQREVDLPALPGVLGLEVVRFYNSYLAGRGGRNGLVGRGWRLSYETSLAKVGNAIEVYQADGTLLRFMAGTEGKYFHRNARFGHLTQLEGKGPRGFIWHWPALPGRLARELVFDAQGRLIEIAQASGEFVSLSYNANGLLSDVTDPQGRKLILHYAKEGFTGVSKIETPAGEFSYRYGYEGAAQALMEAKHASSLRAYHYEDARHPAYLTGISVGEVRTNSWAYDAKGHAVMSVLGKPDDTTEKVTITWPNNQSAIVERAGGKRSLYRIATIAGQRRILSIQELDCKNCAPQQFAFDEQGQKVRTDEHLRFEDARFPFLPTRVTMPSVIHGKQKVLEITYNDAGQITQVTERGFSPVDSQGKPNINGIPIERTTRYRFESINNRSVLVGVSKGLLPEEIHRWDALGNHRVAVERAPGFATRFQHDTLGRIASSTFSDGTREVSTHTQYSNNPLSLQQITNLSRQAKFSGSSPSAKESITKDLVMTASYDERGRRITSTNRWGEQTALTYGANNKPATLTQPNGDQQHFSYDERGRMQAQVTQDAKGKVLTGDLLLRDEQGKLMAHLTPQGVKQAYVYLPATKAASEVSYGPRIKLQDDFGRIVLERHPEDGLLTTTFNSTPDGELQTQRQTGTDGTSQLTETLHFDTLGRLSKRERGACTDTLLYQGLLLQELRGCASTSRYERDAWGRITAQHQQIDSTQYTQRFSYDAKGVLTTRSLPSVSSTAETLSYRYSASGKSIESVALQSSWLKWLPDVLRNLLPSDWFETTLVAKVESARGVAVTSLEHGNGSRQEWLAKENEAPTIAKVSFSSAASAPTIPTRDAFGRQTLHTPSTGPNAGKAQVLVWNEAHQLIEVLDAKTKETVARYTYDATGNRITNATGASTTHYVYDNQHRVITESQQGKIQRHYVYSDHRLHSVVDDGHTYAVKTDWRGLPTKLSDVKGKAVWEQAFDAWGNETATITNAAFTLNHRLAGQIKDEETGLHYNIHRYLDTHAGRYLSADPLGTPDGPNRYAYLNGNPLVGIDPLGLFEVPRDAFFGNDVIFKLGSLGPSDNGHGDIVRIAFAQHHAKHGTRFSAEIINQIIVNNYHADANGEKCYPIPNGSIAGGGQCAYRNHFDNPNNGPQFLDKDYSQLQPGYQSKPNFIGDALEQIKSNRNNYGSAEIAANGKIQISKILNSFGQNTHALADFYAHTNWVDDATRGGYVCNELEKVSTFKVPQSSTPGIRYDDIPGNPYEKRKIEYGYMPVGLEQTEIWDETVPKSGNSQITAGTVNFKAEPVNCPIQEGGKPGDIVCKTDRTTHGYWNKDDNKSAGGSRKLGEGLEGSLKAQKRFVFEAEVFDSSQPSPTRRLGVDLFTLNGQAPLEGEIVYVAKEIKTAHELAYHLAVEHTKKEIEKLYSAISKQTFNGTKLSEIFAKSWKDLERDGIVYRTLLSKN